MTTTPPLEVSAAELNRRFGEIRRRVEEGPVAVTYHGRPIIMMLSKGAFDGLQSLQSGAELGAIWKRKLQLILDHIREGYFSFDDSATIRTVNRVAELFVGQTRDELVGLPFEQAFPAISNLFAEIQNVADTGEIRRVERNSTLHPDRRVAVTMIPLPFPDGGVGVLFDNITEQARMQATLAEQEKAIELLFTAVEDRVIFSVNGKGRIERWGKGAQRALGWTWSDVQNAPMESILVSTVEAAGEGDGEQTVELRHKDGAVIQTHGHVRLLGKETQSAIYVLSAPKP